MNVLSVDTSTSVLHIALVTDKGSEERMLKGFLQPSEMLLSEIKELLKRQELTFNDLDLLVCTRGPGSFTSLRIGFSTLKGISLATGKPLVSVPTLRTIALAAGHSGLTLTVIDAKKKRYYLGLYSENGDSVTEDIDGNAIDLVDILKDKRELFITGPDATTFAEKLAPLVPNCTITVDSTPIRPLGLMMIREGIKQYETVGADDIGQGPVYIRRSDAEEALLKRLEEEKKNEK